MRRRASLSEMRPSQTARARQASTPSFRSASDQGSSRRFRGSSGAPPSASGMTWSSSKRLLSASVSPRSRSFASLIEFVTAKGGRTDLGPAAHANRGVNGRLRDVRIERKARSMGARGQGQEREDRKHPCQRAGLSRRSASRRRRSCGAAIAGSPRIATPAKSAWRASAIPACLGRSHLSAQPRFAKQARSPSLLLDARYTVSRNRAISSLSERRCFFSASRVSSATGSTSVSMR